MTRQALFLRLASCAALLFAFFLAKAPTSVSCRCYPDDPCWPSPGEWGALNASLSGNLVATSPIGSVCHTNNSFSMYNSKECSDLVAHWPIPATHYETSSSPMAAWWTNFSCSPFVAPETPCLLGPLVRYAASVRSATDVQTVLAFARRYNIRLVIRNTGHDYLGKSTGPGALALWTHHLKSIAYEAKYESSWYTGPALRVGAGVQGFEALDAAHALGFIVVTGHCPDVGIAGGYTQGGGHGQLASRFGLAADQVLEWEVVTSTGEYLTVSPIKNADLYWALGGGGGGTYAAVLSMTVKMYPEEKTASGILGFTSSTTLSDFWSVIRTFLIDTLSLQDAGGTVIWLIFPDPSNVGGLMFLASPFTLPRGEKEDLDSYLTSTFDLLRRYNMTYNYASYNFPSYHSAYTTMTPAVNITEFHVGGSLVSRTIVESDTDNFISTLQTILRHNPAISGFAINVSRTDKDQVPNAVNPVWRNATLSLVIGLPFDYTNRQINLDNHKLMTDVLVPQLAALTPPGEEAAAYLNEGDWNQPNWQSFFYGINYNRLREIKDKYDPDQVFYGRTAVGSERWVEREDGRLCRAV
ncbi:hypothetical protein PISL3812_02027 [Talaromyces islandicus]|uniref:FAD-binding PCMH-type domain-containing protein n=1 Tax=Talaromyces islandicus TaxID=28573 RepID=A0A0U1LQH3_TALIS|nr:hypothetical protein PISL3812_02027 [Talaromyces islandicus]